MFTETLIQIRVQTSALFCLTDHIHNITAPKFQVADMLMELYITDLEDIASSAESASNAPKPVTVESTHPYADESFTNGRVKIPGMYSM